MRTRLFLSAMACALGAGTAQAQDFTPKDTGLKMINLRATSVAPDAGDSITTLAGAATGLRAHVSDDVMPTLGLTYFLTDRIAVEAIAGTTKHTIRARGAATDLKVKETWVLPPVVSLQYHPAPAARISPYVGAGVNYMLFYGGSNAGAFRLKVDDGVGYALQAGVDVAATGAWSLNLDAKKVFFETDATDRGSGLKSKVELNPWVLSAGAGYRF